MDKIFKKNSVTFYYSSLFFPKDIRKDIIILYNFVRTPDNLLDQSPQKKEDFLSFKSDTLKTFLGKKSNNHIIREFINLSQRKRIDQEIVSSFLNSLEQDLKKKGYKSTSELNNYTYGSAEMIGLMIAKILDLPKKSYPYAKKLGKSFQFINFLRDIEEDNMLGRTYFSSSDIRRFNLESLKKDYILRHPEEFKKFINYEVNKILKLQKYAEQGFKYIPKKYLIAIKTASDIYKWTTLEIQKNPFLIYQKKIRPSPIKVLVRGVLNTATFIFS